MQTLVVRDEADIVGAQIDYHLNAGVDFVLATDHDSRDGTTEILESYERQGVLRLFREQGEMRESVWRSRMARLAATEHGADWVINTDADEFWMPRRGTLKEALAAVPREFGVVWAITRHFLPRPGNMESFSERMTVRLSATAPLNDPTSPYRPHAKAAHRADPEIVVLFGSHDVVTDARPPARLVSGRRSPLPVPHARAVRAEGRAQGARRQAARPVRESVRGQRARPRRGLLRLAHGRRRDARRRPPHRLARGRHAPA